MKIHSICVAKNESDIIEETLIAASHWSDYIYMLDNGSTDGTWEKVLTLSEKYPQIIPFQQKFCVYYNGLRQEVFEHFRENSEAGDWWCQLDADEIYIDNPRIFLAKIPKKYQTVWSASFAYYFTNKDLELYEQNPDLYSDNVPIEEKCRYYINNWSEARFFRDDEKLVWEAKRRWPYTGAVYPIRIWLNHYQNRSPQQIKQRLFTRLEARQKGTKSFLHLADDFQENIDNSSSLILEDLWKKSIVDASSLNYDNHDNRYILREDLMPKLPLINSFLANKTRNFKKYVNRMTFEKFLRFTRKLKKRNP